MSAYPNRPSKTGVYGYLFARSEPSHKSAIDLLDYAGQRAGSRHAEKTWRKLPVATGSLNPARRLAANDPRLDIDELQRAEAPREAPGTGDGLCRKCAVALDCA